MKKVFFITTRPINPINSGTKVVLYNYCKGLKEKFDCTIYQFTFYESDCDKEIEQPSFIEDIKYIKEPKAFEKIYNLMLHSIILRRWPLQVSLYYNRKTKKMLEKYINEIEPDYIMCDMIRTAEYVRNIKYSKGIKILEMQDVLSKRYERQINNIKKGTDSFGAYGKKIPQFLAKFINSTNIVKFIFGIEKELLYKYEEEVAKDFKNIILVSPKETKELNQRLQEEKCINIPLGVDYEFFSEKIDIKKGRKLIGFIGNMNIAHNKDAINNFIETSFNKLINKDPEIKLKIIGKCSEEFKNQFINNRNIEVTGEVNDIRKYALECNIIIAPLTYGSGIKTKVLESMAMGIPVITNNLGIEGLEIINGKEAIVVNDNSLLDLEIQNLLSDEKQQQRIGIEGQKYIKENFTWDISIPNFNNIIK